MEEEFFCTGYCRAIDGSRMVTLVTLDGRLSEVDCAYPACPNAPGCPIAREMEAHLTGPKP